MYKLNYIIVFALMVVAISSCEDKERKKISLEVKNYGALRTIMSGNIQSVISLDTLSEKKHLYALGAVDNLRGEIQIFDNKPLNSFVVDDNIQMEDSYNLKASLLVYAEVNAWDSFQIDTSKTKSDIEKQIVEIAKNSGIDTEKPFPFLIEGTIASVTWHVINWKESDTIHTHKKHKESGLNGTLVNEEVQIIGFYSTRHKGIFTHHTTNIHMHFKTNDNTIAGHIDDILLNKTVTLKLPKQ